MMAVFLGHSGGGTVAQSGQRGKFHITRKRPFFVRTLPDPHAQAIRTIRDNRRWTMKRILKWYRAA
jgi:hypothetical protein